MSSLDEQLSSLQKPIPKGVDIAWLQSGDTFAPSDENNPNAQAANIMNQLIFNRNIQKMAKKEPTSEEKAIAQIVVAHMQSGEKGNILYGSLELVFGKETFRRCASFIREVESAVGSKSSDIIPSVGVTVAMGLESSSDREDVRQYEAQRTSSSLEAYRDNSKPMKNGDISLGGDEMSIDITATGPNSDVDLSNTVLLDEIKLAASAIMTGSIESGLSSEDDQLNDDIFSEKDLRPLTYVESEQSLLDEETENEDIQFDNGLIDLESINMSSENALMGCDEDLTGIVAQTPPIDLLSGEEGATICFEDLDKEIETEEGSIQLNEIKQAFDIGAVSNDDFEIEL